MVDEIRDVRVAEGHHARRIWLSPRELSTRPVAGAVRAHVAIMGIEDELEEGPAIGAVQAAKRSVLDVVVMLLSTRAPRPSRTEFLELADAAYGSAWPRARNADRSS